MLKKWPNIYNNNAMAISIVFWNVSEHCKKPWLLYVIYVNFEQVLANKNTWNQHRTPKQK